MDELIKSISEYIAKMDRSVRLDEILTPEEDARITKELMYPTIRPQNFDVTVGAWLERLKMWGTASITHTKTEKGIKNKAVTPDQLCSIFGDQVEIQLYGKWDIELQAVDRVKFVRHYFGADAKEYQEYFIIKVDLRKDILDKLKKSDPLGWMRIK